MTDKAITRLANNNLSSIDLSSSDYVQMYLDGDIGKKYLSKRLNDRKRELKETLKEIDKVIKMLPHCPDLLETKQ